MPSVNEIISLINNQIDSQEKIQGYLFQAEALAQVALNKDFLGCEDFIINEYLGLLYEVIMKLKHLQESVLNELIKNSGQNERKLGAYRF